MSAFPSLGSSKETGNPQGIWLWRPAGFDYRTSTGLGETETPVLEGTNKILRVPRLRGKEHWSHRRLNQTCLLAWLAPICLFLLLFLLPWETDLRKHCYNLCQRMFCLCALLGVLRCHIFKSLGHFEFIFVCSVRVSSNLVNLHATVQLSQDCLQRACLFPIVDSLFLWWRLVAQRCVGLFLGSMFCSRDPHVCFCASTMLFWLRWLSSLGGLCLHLSCNIKF